MQDEIIEHLQFKINIFIIFIFALIIITFNNINILYNRINEQQHNINLLQDTTILKHLIGANCYKTEDTNIYNILNDYKDNPYIQNKIRVLLVEYLISLQEIKENSNIIENENKIINNEIKCYIDNLLSSIQEN
jgi:hypothetical protein